MIVCGCMYLYIWSLSQRRNALPPTVQNILFLHTLASIEYYYVYFPSFLVCIKNWHHIFKSLIEVQHLLFMYLLSISFSCEIKLDFVLYLSASGVREPISMDSVNYVSWKRSSDNNDSRPSILQCVQGSPIELWLLDTLEGFWVEKPTDLHA